VAALTKQSFFFPCRTSTGRNLALRAKNQSFSENMAENLVSTVGFFRKIDLKKNGID